MRSIARERTPKTKLSRQRRHDCVGTTNGAARIRCADGKGIHGSVDRVQNVRMDRAGILGIVQCVGRHVPGESGASHEVDCDAGRSSGADTDSLPGGSKHCPAITVAVRVVFVPVLALLATLVSTSVFSFLLRGDGQAGASGYSRMGGREAHGV